MFGITDGFDIVIGNPPYIQLQKDHGELGDKYKPQNFESFSKTGDIYILFYERGIQLLKNDGYLCFITSNKWMTAGYGERLRLFFSKQNPLIIIDIGHGIFDGATVDTNILLIQKSKNKNQFKGITLHSKDDIQDISNFVKLNAVSLPNMNKSVWFIGNKIEQHLKEKMESIGTPLKNWNVNIYSSFKTGLNEAFVIDSKKREEILSNCKSENERL
ncbi:MAG: Eco57I restriction-modification methylase domain-containing protein [Candidatus Micrarchaeaceae archaeon]